MAGITLVDPLIVYMGFAGFQDVLEVYHIRRASGMKINSNFLIPCPASANKLRICWPLLLQKRETRSWVIYKAETCPNDITLREYRKVLQNG